jgi:hypothetical protein
MDKSTGIDTATRGRVQSDLTQELAGARVRLSSKLASLDLPTVGISDYNQRYLADHLATRDDATLRMYSRLIALALQGDTHLQDAVLVDFGGGHGLMSFLAKELGVGTVIYVDIYEVSCEDVRRLGALLDLTPDHVVCGDLDALLKAAETIGLAVTSMVSSDVIEHIYDVKKHFATLSHLPRGRFRAVYASTANIENPRYVRWVSAQQRAAELTRRPDDWGRKERDSLLPYRSIRTNIVRAASTDLTSSEIQRLAVETRGLNKADIEASVHEYVTTGKITYKMSHPTNTCDPITGNWAEHLMDLDWLQGVSTSAGFATRIAPGYYELHGSKLKRAGQTIANLAITLLGRRGMALAPHYVMTADWPARMSRDA